ncbi:unnamed protein product [Phaedon cochleariae]|uniref:Regulator of G-protein signalling DHEX domain-containing protein n=1 Tax=Phaedon cochleariae TaxID=80249 RepID=A0A9N9SG37_PHACE|nr:unnamed protein product [Phaedon cochleariae]
MEDHCEDKTPANLVDALFRFIINAACKDVKQKRSISLINIETLKNEVEEAKKTGSMDEVFGRYCNKRPQMTDCLKKTRDAIAPCLEENEKNAINFTANIVKQLGDFACVKDGDRIAQALNIANQLCQYGYFFPISDSKNLVVKDDSSLYRFQNPYYWPWQNRSPDNVEYAIYLAKRTLRNKQRHGLEEYELESLSNLKKNLANKWDFIMIQAEEQVKASKGLKKADKLVADSQERAYWRVHRPPPGMVGSLEPCPVPTRSWNGGCRTRKRTIEDCRREQVKRTIHFGSLKMPDNAATVTNKLILDEIIKTRNELKNSIEASEARLLLKLEEANDKINKLELENKILKDKVEYLEREAKRKNLIVFGLQKASDEITPEFICSELEELLDVRVNQSEISDLYTIGIGENRPLKIEFVNNFIKSKILKNCSKLKGTNIRIANDLTLKQRQDGQLLRKHLTLARLNDKNSNCFIRRNKLVVDNTSYSPEELEKSDTNEEIVAKPNSATPIPEVPNTSIRGKKQDKDILPVGHKLTRSRTGPGSMNRS